MPAQKLKMFLDRHQIRYVTIHHSPAYTAQEIAAKSHIPGKELAKTVMVKIDGKIAMAVLPASFKVDLEDLKLILQAKKVELAHENDFASMFPGCEVGAMPPFGNLYDMAVYLDDSLADDEEITFNAGSHSELIRMSYKDYATLVQPTMAVFALVGTG